MLIVVVDTNILISALVFGGAPDELIKLARVGEIKLCLSEFIINETSRVLLNKFRWSQAEVEKAITLVRGFSYLVTPTQTLTVIQNDDSDNRIVECAAAAGADFLVSGDTRHVLPLKQHENIKIVSTSEFLRTFQTMNRRQ